MPPIPQNILTRTLVLRMVHIDCLETLLLRDALHAPSFAPNDGLPYVGIHAEDVQAQRGPKPITCGPGGVIRDYVGFYFGPRSPMLLRIQTGRGVPKMPATEIIYLVAIAQDIAASNTPFVFMDRHSLTRVAAQFDDLDDLSRISFDHAYADQWNKTSDEPDRQELKHAEFLIYRFLPWRLIVGIGVFDGSTLVRVNSILQKNPNKHQTALRVKADWFY